jgi:hypothetical protein
VTVADMPRKNAGYRLDDRCINALKVLAERAGKSINEYLEELLFAHGKLTGVIDKDAKPLGETRGGARQKAPTPETRGGKRPGAGRPKVAPASDHPLAQDSAESEESQSDDEIPGEGQR